ncbi:hypothetical protein GCM10027418_27730 [Mariniluteicoccus endophyticus]
METESTPRRSRRVAFMLTVVCWVVALVAGAVLAAFAFSDAPWPQGTMVSSDRGRYALGATAVGVPALLLGLVACVPLGLLLRPRPWSGFVLATVSFLVPVLLVVVPVAVSALL